MRRRRQLLESERAMLRELAIGPDYARAIGQRTGQTYTTVRQILLRLEARGYLKGQRLAGGGLRPRVVYRLTAEGRQTLAETGKTTS